MKLAHFFEDYSTFAAADYQPLILNDNNWIIKMN